MLIERQKQYLDYLIDPNFQGVNRLFVFSFEDNVVMDRQNSFAQAVKNDIRTYDIIRKIAIGQWDDYTTGFLLDYPYLKKHYKMIAIDLSKQQALDADPKAIQQISFTENLDWAGNTTIFFIIEDPKETKLNFSVGTLRVLYFYFVLI